MRERFLPIPAFKKIARFSPFVAALALAACEYIPTERVCNYLQSPDVLEVYLPLNDTGGERMWGRAFVSENTLGILREKDSTFMAVNIGPFSYHTDLAMGYTPSASWTALVDVVVDRSRNIRSCAVTTLVDQRKTFDFYEPLENPHAEPFPWH